MILLPGQLVRHSLFGLPPILMVSHKSAKDAGCVIVESHKRVGDTIEIVYTSVQISDVIVDTPKVQSSE